jgi:hypothetical protein
LTSTDPGVQGSQASGVQFTPAPPNLSVGSQSTTPDDSQPAPDSNQARSPSPVILLLNPSPAPAAKPNLTPDDVMKEFESKTLNQLRDLQNTHIRYKKLNFAIKIEAQNLYFDYQRKQHLLSLKYSRPFRLLTKYLGQCRTQQKQSNWHNFQKTDPGAKEALKNSEYHSS